jgi:phosphoribosyl 1,2-cyclic phosphodiesterase
MLLRCCGSSSAGNSYALISSSGEILAIEAGVKFTDFKKMINWRVSDVVGCIVSHEHG